MGDSTQPADRLYADLHVHSKYSRACSKDSDLEHLAWYARRKGISLVGTGDFTHPAWHQQLRENLVPAEPGLFTLNPELTESINRRLPKNLHGQTRFMLSVEISTIYKRDDRTRKVHHLVYLPDLDAVERFNSMLGRIGNLGSDGRPILGLNSRDLLEIVLESSPDGYLIPAHIWTPWFSALGSKSGFDSIADCYADLADHIFAVETGLSSDPGMNSQVSSLDKYTMVSNSDAHSPPMLGREATILSTGLDYFAIRDALRTRQGYEGTLEFFPEEGKYHADGHRRCGVVLTPEETRAAKTLCPVCGKPVTVGVLSRVTELSDRPAQPRPGVINVIPLPEILGEIHAVGPKTKTVTTKLDTLVAELGPEFDILTTVPVADVTRAGGELLGEAIRRLRHSQVQRVPGYDGEYGTIRLFSPEEIGSPAPEALFDGLFEKVTPEPKPPRKRKKPESGAKEDSPPLEPASIARQSDLPAPSPHEPMEPVLLGMEEVGTGLLDRLDAMQRVAASASTGAMLIVAGPGTGKTHTLTHRIAYLVAELGVPPEQCVAIAFTQRAADELTNRLHGLLSKQADGLNITTFHGLSSRILRENHDRVGLSANFKIIDDLDDTTRKTRSRTTVKAGELIGLAAELLAAHPELTDRYHARWPWMFVDEYQDIDAERYRLLTLLSPHDGNLYAIGDPDQAIYGSQGADVKYFLRFSEDFPQARTVRLTRNYRSAAPILAAAVQAITPGSLVPGRILEPARRDPDSALVGLYSATSETDEADYVARTIEELTHGPSQSPTHGSSTRATDSRRANTPTDSQLTVADIAVLYRTEGQSEAIRTALVRAGIPAREHPQDGLRTESRTGAEVDTFDPPPAHVTLRTLHAAKGMEFPVVFIVGCQDGLLPMTSPGGGVDIAEERRLFFVGLTRAQDRLYLSHATRGPATGEPVHGEEPDIPPSPFLSAIDPSLLARRGAGISRRKQHDQQLRLL